MATLELSAHGLQALAAFDNRLSPIYGGLEAMNATDLSVERTLQEAVRLERAQELEAEEQARLTEAQQATQANANRTIITGLRNLLPPPADYSESHFIVDTHQQARFIQGSVLWANKAYSYYPRQNPYYILGRTATKSRWQEVLLMQAAISQTGLALEVASVLTEHLTKAEDLQHRVLTREYNAEQAKPMIDKVTGNIRLDATTPGSMVLDPSRFAPGKSQPVTKAPTDQRDRPLQTYALRSRGELTPVVAPTDELMERFNVPSALALLAVRFGKQAELRLLYETALKPPEPVGLVAETVARLKGNAKQMLGNLRPAHSRLIKYRGY
ncbi:MAG: hypothetical protein JWN38_621 [Candidatus Saccharibacteria bacterium]|nr:hypothetical protein [Candidatus Saccharibacteria bacterium]